MARGSVVNLTLADAHQLLASNRDLINNTWHFFVSVHLALFAVAMFSPNRAASGKPLLLLLPFYAGFMYLNYQAQLDNYNYAKQILDYIATLTQGSSEMAILTASFHKGWLLPYLGWIYTAVGVFSSFVVIVFAFQKPPVREVREILAT